MDSRSQCQMYCVNNCSHYAQTWRRATLCTYRIAHDEGSQDACSLRRRRSRTCSHPPKQPAVKQIKNAKGQFPSAHYCAVSTVACKLSWNTLVSQLSVWVQTAISINLTIIMPITTGSAHQTRSTLWKWHLSETISRTPSQMMPWLELVKISHSTPPDPFRLFQQAHATSACSKHPRAEHLSIWSSIKKYGSAAEAKPFKLNLLKYK